jgi:hypothetical protein
MSNLEISDMCHYISYDCPTEYHAQDYTLDHLSFTDFVERDSHFLSPSYADSAGNVYVSDTDHSLYTTCSLINGRAYLHSGMVSIIFFLTKYCCSSIPEVPSIVTNLSDWAIESYCSIILLWNIL